MAHVSFRRASRRRLPRAQRLAVVRLAPRALRRRAVARARLDARRAGDHLRRGARPAADAALDQVERELGEGSFPFADGDEDIHMAIERRVTEIAGPGRREAAHRPLAQRPGGDRRRDVRPRPRPRARSTRIERARRDADRRWPRRISTGRCPATPTCSVPSRSTSATTCSPTSGCSLRDRDRFESVIAATGALPLGAGALAGRQLRHRPRAASRASSASRRWPRTRSTPSRTATSCSTTSRPPPRARPTCRASGAEIVLWSSEEFGFCEVSDAWASGSSIMPQKKNPDAAELLRAKAPRVAGHLVALHGVHARPAADLQQGHAGGQGAPVRRCRHARAVARRGGRDARDRSRFRRERLAARGRATSCSRRPTSPTCSCAAGCRSARRTASSPGSCGTRSTRTSALSELTPR